MRCTCHFFANVTILLWGISRTHNAKHSLHRWCVYLFKQRGPLFIMWTLFNLRKELCSQSIGDRFKLCLNSCMWWQCIDFLFLFFCMCEEVDNYETTNYFNKNFIKSIYAVKQLCCNSTYTNFAKTLFLELSLLSIQW